MNVSTPRTSTVREARSDRFGARSWPTGPQGVGRERERGEHRSGARAAVPAELGYVGLQQSLAALPDQPGTAAGTLLVALIHSMGGAATSVARGLYVNTLT